MDIHDYHWIWYVLGFLFAPRVVLAVFLCVYLPIGLPIKIIACILAFFIGEIK